MRITVQYLTQIKRAAGMSQEHIEASAPLTLRELMCLCAERHDRAVRAMLVDDAGEPLRSLLLFVGDEHADLTRPLRDGDWVSVLAPMAGG